MAFDHDIDRLGIRLASNQCPHPLVITFFMLHKNQSQGSGFAHVNVITHPRTLPLIPHKIWRLVSCPSDASRGPENRFCEKSLHPWKAHNQMIENRVIRDARIVVWDSQVICVGEGTQSHRECACEVVLSEIPAATVLGQPMPTNNKSMSFKCAWVNITRQKYIPKITNNGENNVYVHV